MISKDYYVAKLCSFTRIHSLWPKILTPSVSAIPVMQGLVDFSCMGRSFLTANTFNIHPSGNTLCPSQPLTAAFHQEC